MSAAEVGVPAKSCGIGDAGVCRRIIVRTGNGFGYVQQRKICLRFVAAGETNRTIGADPPQFDDLAADQEAQPGRLLRQQGRHFTVVHFRDCAAVLADQELTDMPPVWFSATDKGIQRFDAMHQALVLKEFQGAVYGRRRRPPPLTAQSVEEVVGLDRFVTVPDQLKHPPAQIRQPVATPLTFRFGGRNSVGDALFVAVRRRLERS